MYRCRFDIFGVTWTFHPVLGCQSITLTKAILLGLSYLLLSFSGVVMMLSCKGPDPKNRSRIFVIPCHFLDIVGLGLLRHVMKLLWRLSQHQSTLAIPGPSALRQLSLPPWDISSWWAKELCCTSTWDSVFSWSIEENMSWAAWASWASWALNSMSDDVRWCPKSLPFQNWRCGDAGDAGDAAESLLRLAARSPPALRHGGESNSSDRRSATQGQSEFKQVSNKCQTSVMSELVCQVCRSRLCWAFSAPSKVEIESIFDWYLENSWNLFDNLIIWWLFDDVNCLVNCLKPWAFSASNCRWGLSTLFDPTPTSVPWSVEPQSNAGMNATHRRIPRNSNIFQDIPSGHHLA